MKRKKFSRKAYLWLLWAAITFWLNCFPFQDDGSDARRHPAVFHLEHPWYPYARYLVPLGLAVLILRQSRRNHD